MRKNLYKITSKYTREKIINEEVFVRVKKNVSILEIKKSKKKQSSYGNN